MGLTVFNQFPQLTRLLARIEAETRLELLQSIQMKFPELEKPFDCWAME